MAFVIPIPTVVCEIKIETGFQRPNRTGQMIGRPHIIGIEKRYQSAILVGFVEAPISRLRDAAVFLPDKLDPNRISKVQITYLLICCTRRPIVDDDDFDEPTRGDVLRQD